MKLPAVIGVAVFLLLLICPRAEGAPNRPGGGPIVKEIGFVGNSSLGEDQLKPVMRTKESRFLRKRRYRESTLESDLVSLVALYRRSGYLEATAAVEGLRYSEDRSKVWITIRITEGDRTVVKEVILEGNNQVAGDALRRLITVKAGEPLDERRIGEDQYNIYAYYADRGFVFASVTHALDKAGGQATVRYVIEEGGPAAIDRIDVRGSQRVSPKVVKREVTLKPGDIFSRKKVLDSQQRLYDTGLFRDVEIEPAQSSGDSGLVQLIVKIKERKTREVSTGVGYGTRDETRVTLGWVHRNLWNSGRQVEVSAVLASRDLTRGLTRKRADVSFTDRWLFGLRLGGAASVFVNETLEEQKTEPAGEYTLDRMGANLSIEKELSNRYQLGLAYTHEFVDIRDPSWSTSDSETLRLSLGQAVNRSLALLAERDTRVPFFDPHRGSLTRVVAKSSGGVFGGDNSFNKITVSLARYLQISDRAVVAAGLRAGQAEAFGKSEAKGVPEYEKFKVGGSSTVRGYDEGEFGPGDFFLVGNAEVRYAIVWKIAGVAFFDMGNAWPSIREVSRSDFDFSVPSGEYAGRRRSDCKYSVGVGIGAQTPVGPARIDYGFKLKRGVLESREKESTGMVHISIGHAF
ncbi:MAG: outer membrane protein assembly factor BamA [bacterium]